MTKTAALEQGPRGIRVNAAAPGPIAGRMTFKLADEVFAGSKKPSPRRFPLGATARPKTLRASSRSYCRTTPVMRPARPTPSMEDSRPPDYAASRLKDRLPNGPPMGITTVRPGAHPARTGAFLPDAGVVGNQILRSLQ
jgi:NAD(P)-dependent dehydrogenase (short-subunit alcohol dehydrogenase family)